MNQVMFIQCILDKLNITNSKGVCISWAANFKLFVAQCSTDGIEKEKMPCVYYNKAVDSLMYLMICTRPNIALELDKVSNYMLNPENVH